MDDSSPQLSAIVGWRGARLACAAHAVVEPLRDVLQGWHPRPARLIKVGRPDLWAWRAPQREAEMVSVQLPEPLMEEVERLAARAGQSSSEWLAAVVQRAVGRAEQERLNDHMRAQLGPGHEEMPVAFLAASRASLVGLFEEVEGDT